MRTAIALKYLLIIALFAEMGCQKTSINPTFTIGKTSTFQTGRLYFSSDGLYTIQINEVSDSRCPLGVECFWAGEVSLKGEWTVGIRKTPFELHTLLKNLQQQPDGFTIQLVDVKPYPSSGTPSKPEDLEITLLIQKN